MNVRKGQIDITLNRKTFEERIREKLFYDPAFESNAEEVNRIIDLAWTNYSEYHKSPRKRPAGNEFKEADFELPQEWLEARKAIIDAEAMQKNPQTKSRILVICASPRNDQTCPGEMSKTYRLAQTAASAIESNDFECDFLDLSRLTSEFGKNIFPCKACVSTAMPLCHWPCSCYPNHALSQTNDWMNEIFERWVRAHGIMIVTPVHWYQVPSTLKLMMDRLVCADGGNPDPTTTRGKDPEMAKDLELKGWSYPKHLAGRSFAVVVHGDATGVNQVKRSLVDWLQDLELIQAGPKANLDRYIGYYKSYASSHDELDKDEDIQKETEVAALTLLEHVRWSRNGRETPPDHKMPRQK